MLYSFASCASTSSSDHDVESSNVFLCQAGLGNLSSEAQGDCNVTRVCVNPACSGCLERNSKNCALFGKRGCLVKERVLVHRVVIGSILDWSAEKLKIIRLPSFWLETTTGSARPVFKVRVYCSGSVRDVSVSFTLPFSFEGL